MVLSLSKLVSIAFTTSSRRAKSSPPYALTKFGTIDIIDGSNKARAYHSTSISLSSTSNPDSGTQQYTKLSDPAPGSRESLYFELKDLTI